MHLPEIVTTSLGWLAFEFARVQPLLPTYGHLLLSAIFPIFAGSYASLSRPSSAAKPPKTKKSTEDADDEDEVEEVKMEGLSPYDAIMFPLLAGATLTGLYFLIKWLQDLALLNKILNWYFAAFSVFSVSKLVSDALDVFHSFLFPHDFVDRGIIYHVKPKQKRAIANDVAISTHRLSPLPGMFSRLSLPQALLNIFWTLHILPNRKLTFSGVSQPFGAFRYRLGIHGIEGLAVGIVTVLYYNLVDKPWYLTNLMGFGFAYGALQLMSPTTFTTGTMLLGALLCYDFYMVFKTPMMVTVAKSLDIPIKLLFPRPPDADADPASKALSMLGLGDVVLPGIMIGLALRFDLYLFYLRKQTTSQAAEAQHEPTDAATKSTESQTAEVTATTPKAGTLIKALYTPITEAWGDRFWTSTFLSFYSASKSARSYTPRNTFPKPYFTAGLVGYVVGMVSTLAAMQISSHPQPALIYLVPAVLTALWGTAVLRGEVNEMWNFSDAAEDEEDVAQKEKKDGKDGKKQDSSSSAQEKKSGTRSSIFGNERAEERAKAIDKYFTVGPSSEREAVAEGSNKNVARAQRGQTLFSFSIVAPLPYWSDTDELSGKSSTRADETGEMIKEVSTTPHEAGEHVEKKRRIN